MPLQLSLFDAFEPGPPPAAGGAVLVARGALAAEALLLSQIEELLAAARRDPSLLALPVRIVVPSRSLRSHLAAAIVRARGRSVAGITVQTLHGLAFEVLERAGESAPRGMRVSDVLSQRMARSEPALRRGLDGLVDGYTAVAATVRDLLDAGLEPAHAEAADEALASDGPRAGTRAEVERARALVRVAARTELALREIGLGRLSTLLRLAAERIAEDPGRFLPSRGVFIHGFAEATGVATDLLQALVRRCEARLVLDRPLDPGAGSRGAAGVETAYTERLAERLAFARFDTETASPPVAPRVESFEAAGSEAEVREAALRIRALLDEGARPARPEAIGIVARDLGRYRLALRRHLERLGIPFSGIGEHGALEPAGRRARAFLDLLRRGEEAAADRWLDALATLPVSGGRAPLGYLQVDLRLAFYSLGAGRLREVAELPVDAILRGETSYALPIRQGLRSGKQEDLEEEAEEGGNGSQGTYAARRRVAGSHIRRAVRAAGRLRDRLASWPEQARAGEHLDRLRALALRDLGWELGSEEARPVFAALEELEREVPAELPLTRDELRLLLAGVLRNAGTSEIGGRGGGVQVLSVMEARGRTFDHLFVIGLNRDVFPRGVREDPLLRDDLRRILRRVLPDVPVKRSGFDEERYLFAQLLSSSPAVTLSWQIADEDGKPLSPSPLVGRLRGEPRPERAPSLFALPDATKADESGRLRPAAEHAVIAALYAPRRRFAQALPLAVREVLEAEPERGAEAVLTSSATLLAAARLAALEELDPDRRTPEGRAAASRLGPYFGFVGALAEAISTEPDPRRNEIYVTALEGLAACPWQLFLGRLLRIEPTPDPLEAAPGADPLMLGNVVHAVLDRIVRDSLDAGASPEEDFAALSVRSPFLVPWPAGEDLERIAREEAARLLALEGLFLPGLARALAERALPFLDNARQADWNETGLPVLGSEVQGMLPARDAAGRIRSIRFKADRMDLTGGRLRSTDYKTGKPISEARKADYRRRHFLDRVREGKNLQGVAYLLAVPRDSEAPRPAVGRYLYLRPELKEREFEVELSDSDFLGAFGGTVEAVLGAWDAGSFFPRLVDIKGIKEPQRCSFCAVSEACLRNDSGSRLRLFEWTERARSAPSEENGTGPAETALLRVWRLPAKEEKAGPMEKDS